MFKKVLVANRGEIACRIIKTLRKMGIKSVAVYSDADENALHRQMADESVYIGTPPVSESYCNIPAIMSAIQASEAEAVHPGFGLLSENANFVKLLEKNNIIFIGPNSNVIAKMGDKIEAKRAAIKAGVPIIKGFNDKLFGASHALTVSESIGFPVMLKAAAGGGGKGMRIVYAPEEVINNYNLATNEALKSFNDGTIFIEKYLEEPRHIEIQVMCDKHGNVLCLGERECSIQRKHQKIIEEAPSVVVDERLRKNMYKTCAKLLNQEGYTSAGTIEFLVDKKGNFYFLEMNTRIQVEHTVTELITGLDIVELMIKSAAGISLGLSQKDIVLNGWAIESRVCAENPSRDFLPACGPILRYREPYGPNIRVDSGIKEGDMVTPFYDSMLLKLCVHGKTREDAIKLMMSALDSLVIDGVSTNIEFLSSIFRSNDFCSGKISTNFIKDHYRDGFKGIVPGYGEMMIFVCVASFVYLCVIKRRFFAGELDVASNIKINQRFFNLSGIRKINILHLNDLHEISIVSFDDVLKINFNGKNLIIKSDWWFGDDIFSGVIDEKEKLQMYIKFINDITYEMRYHGVLFRCSVFEDGIGDLIKFMPEKKSDMENDLQVVSPINGMISLIMVASGDRVEIGDSLCVVTAMKMENVIKSDCAAIVDEVKVSQGDSLNAGDVIITFKPKM